MERTLPDGRLALYRHPLWLRCTHWLNALCLLVLLLSGLQILNAHPSLYWGEVSRFDHPWLAIHWRRSAGVPVGWTLPDWPDLGAGRRWHFFFAWLFAMNGVLYLTACIVTGRLRNALLPDIEQLRNLGKTVLHHLRLQFPQGEAAREYNVLQKLTYLIVVLVLLPLMLLTGITMSPGMDARLHLLTDLFGGRQSARTVHFLVACSLVLFVVVHLAAVLAAGPITEIRSMLTGWFIIGRQRK